MSDSFERNDEWVEISDSEGHKQQLQHLATIQEGEKVYHILGKEEDEDGDGGFMLIREEKIGDGARKYIACDDENEIDRVVGRYVMHTLMDVMVEQGEEDDELCAICRVPHGPLEKCFCGQKAFLQ